jgi:hypothetical protein
LIALSTSKPVGNIVNEINLGKGAPTSILYDPKNGYTYVAIISGGCLVASEIYVIANYTEVSEIPTLLPLEIMCYNPQNGDVYVDLGLSISVINGTTIVSNIALNGLISTMLYDRLNGILYASANSYTKDNNTGAIYAINVSNNTIIGHVSIGNSSSQHMLLNPSNGYIYVSLTNGSIIVLTPNLEIIGTINVNASVYSMLYDPVNGYIYVDGVGSNGVGELVVINPSDNSVIGFIRVSDYELYSPSEPMLTYNPSNGYVYVVDGNYISVISSNNLVAEIPIGSLTFAVTYSPENNYVYVSADGMISVIDPEYDFVISNLTAPNDLQYSLMTYGNGYIYDADYLTNGTTQVIIIGLQSVQKEEGSLVVNVYNYTLGSPVVGGITYGLLINSENQVVEKAYINSYSQLVFTNVTPGQYVVDVYHIPSSGMNITEYWGNITVNVTSLPYTVNFIRNAPVIYSLNYTIANGRYNISAVIYNPRNYSIEATVYFYTPSSLIPASIERYLAPGYNYFSLGIPSSTPYVDVVVSAYLSNYLGTPIPTDEKVLRFVTETPIELNLIPYFYNSSAMGAVYLNFTQAELGLFMPPVMLGNLSIPGILDFNNMSYFVHTLKGPYVFNTTFGSWKVYGFTFVALPTYGNGSVVNSTYMLQKTMIIAYNGEKVIVLLYYRNLAPVPLELNQYWSHIHKGVDGLSFAVYPDLFNPYVNATEQVIQDAYYIDGNTSLYVNGSYLGQLNSFGLWQVLPVGPITLIDNVSGWDIQLIPINNLSTTQQIQLVTNGFSIDNVTIANSFFNIQHAKITLLPNQSAQYVYSIGINTQPPNYTEISGILSYLIQIASSSVPHNTTPPTLSSLSVKVFNVLGRLATTVPGVVLGVLYNSSFKEVVYMNSSGYLNFYGLSPGTYTLEVYHYPNTGLNLTEYWGGMTVNLQPGSNFVTFYRHEPWIYNLQVSASNREIVVTVTVNGTVTSPTPGEIELWVTNNPSLASPYSPSTVFNFTINPGFNTFNFTYPVSKAGTYYVYAAVLTHISIYTVTDQWNWTAITISSVPHNTSSTLIVTVYNVNGKLASSLPGVVYGILVNDQTGQQVAKAFMNSESLLVFNGIPQGNYTLFVYHYPNIGLNFTEFWGIENVSVLPGKTVYLNFTRYEPWIYDVNSIPLLNGSVYISVEVYNPLSDTVMGEIDIYENASSQPNSGALIITRQEIISPGLNKFSFIYTPNTGEFYLYTVLKVNLTVLHVTSFHVTDQYNWTLFASLNGPITVYVPVWFNGTIYYVYWDINGVPSKSIKIGLDPYSFLDLVLRLNSSRANIIFSGITYQNNTPLTNTSMEELILEYLYLWLLLEGKLATIVQNYGINSPGYQFINITIQGGIPTIITIANDLTYGLYDFLNVFEIVEHWVEGDDTSNGTLVGKIAVTFFDILKLACSHDLQKMFGNQVAQEIKELFKQYGLPVCNFFESLQEFEALSSEEAVSLIASLYEIIYHKTLPKPVLEAADIAIIHIISKGEDIFVESFVDSLQDDLAGEGIDQGLASMMLQNFKSNLEDVIKDSLLKPENLELFVVTVIADIILKLYLLPAAAVYSAILSLINLINDNYNNINNLIYTLETAGVANLTLAGQLYSDMVLNNLYWSKLWYYFYLVTKLPHFSATPPREDYLIYSNDDYLYDIYSVRTLANLGLDAQLTIQFGYISPYTIFVNNIWTPVVPVYSSSTMSTLNLIISIKSKITQFINKVTSVINELSNSFWTIIKVFGDPPLVVINVNSTYILLNGTTIYTTNPFAFISYQNNTYSVVLPISNITYLGLESNETTQITITPVTNKTSIANLTLSPYNAEIFRVKGLNISIMNTTTTINTQGMISLTGNNNLSFVWLSNGNLVVKGLPPGQYVVHKLVTNTTIQQTSVSSQNTTEITQIPVGPSAPIVQSSNNNFNMLPVLILVILVVVLAVVIILYKRLK